MTDLQNRTILIVEDEYLLAHELELDLRAAGADILGPIATLQDAMDLVAQDRPLDGAVLDMNLQGSAVFPLADMLLDRRVPFVFTTGYDALVLPPRLRDIRRFEKPLDVALVLQMMARLIGDGPPRPDPAC